MKKVFVRAKQNYDKFPGGVRVRKPWFRTKKYFTSAPEEVELTPDIVRMLNGNDIEIVQDLEESE